MPDAASDSNPVGGIHTPGSIWCKALEQRSTVKQDGNTESHIYFVGASGSGKSTLINKFLYPNKVEAAKPSPGLEYTFARKTAAHDMNRKDVAHIWELAGGEDLTAELARGSHVFLTHRQVTTSTVVVVLDLSDPGTAASNALHWLQMVQQKLVATYSLFQKGGLAQLPQQLKTRQRIKVLGQRVDAQLVNCSGVSLVLACTKWDALKDKADPEALRVLSRTLRWLAHSNAAHLIYLGGLQPGVTGADELKLLDTFSKVINHLAFVGMDRKIVWKQVVPAIDHLRPIIVPAGTDSFSSIGLPHTAPDHPTSTSSSSNRVWDLAGIADGQQQWLAAVKSLWPSKKAGTTMQDGKHHQNAPAFSANYKEDEVDAAYSQREAALEAHRRELQGAEQEQRRARRKVAAASTVAAAQAKS